MHSSWHSLWERYRRWTYRYNGHKLFVDFSQVRCHKLNYADQTHGLFTKNIRSDHLIFWQSSSDVQTYHLTQGAASDARVGIWRKGRLLTQGSASDAKVGIWRKGRLLTQGSASDARVGIWRKGRHLTQGSASYYYYIIIITRLFIERRKHGQYRKQGRFNI